jgi:hypothetical protein
MAKADECPPSLRCALTPSEAAQALGCSRDFFDKHIGSELRWVRRGRLKFVVEVEDWLRRGASFTLDRECDPGGISRPEDTAARPKLAANDAKPP